MKLSSVVVIGIGVWIFFLFGGNKIIEASSYEASCYFRLIGRLEAGDTVVTVRGEAGLEVVLTDYWSGATLGTGTLSGTEQCRASAEIALSQPLVGEQAVRASADNFQEAQKWVWPTIEPTIEITPYCTNDGTLNGMLYGFDWEEGSTVSLAWEGAVLDTVTATDGSFVYPISLTDLENGVYDIVASSSDHHASTLFEQPCPDFGDSAEIEGTIYIEANGTWQPASHAPVFFTVDDTDFSDSVQARRNGRYHIETPFAESHTIISCVEVAGVVYTDTASNIYAPANDIDLYLSATDSADCHDGIRPQEPADLTIGAPQITPIDAHNWAVSVLITNTSSITVAQSFYVDAWLRHGDAFNYVTVPGLAAHSSQTVEIDLAAPYPIDQAQTVYVMVDGGYEIDEFDESNNRASNQLTPTSEITSVAIYMLAFDNLNYSAGNLTPQLADTLKGIRAATHQNTNKLAIVLADLDQDGDTHVMTIYNGHVDYVEGLPDSNGTLDESIREYDMSDGNTLGGFLLWARTNFPAAQTSLFMYAHGAPLAPDTDLNNVFDLETQSARNSTPIPLPSWVWTNPDFTDMHPVGLLTPHDLQVALDIATDSGADKFDVVDLVHCFSLSIEEAYEIAPYTDAIAGSPNYAYFEATLPGAALEAIEGWMDGPTLADNIIATYNEKLPSEGYPRLLAAVDTSHLETTKVAWDVVSAELINAFDADHADTRAKIAAAYQDSAKYDTTFCEPDWTLGPPDALSDMYEFGFQLEQQFGQTSAVGTAARVAIDSLANAVTSRYDTDGVPHFTSDQVAPRWEFSGLGVALYTDFGGIERETATQLSWHADFYTRTVSAENPHPYQFVSAATSWADVFARYWQGIETTAHGCVATFPPVRDSGELQIMRLLNPQSGETALNTPLKPSINLQVAGELGNVVVQFAIAQNGATVYSNTIGTGRTFTGTHWIKASHAWTPTTTDPFTLTVTVDPENYIDEGDESDNQLQFVDSISAESGNTLQPDAMLTNNQQWITSLNAPLTLNSSRYANPQLEVVAYQFAIGSGVGIPVAQHTTLVTPAGDSAAAALDDSTTAGAIQLHVWEVDGSKRSQLPATLHLNYIPANTPIGAGELDCFPFSATVGDQIQIGLNVPTGADANLFVWYPHSYDAPDLIGTRVGDDNLLIDSAPISGEYLLCVRGETAGRSATGSGTTYTLSVVENGEALFAHPTTPENRADATIPASRILYEDPAPSTRATPSSITLDHHAAAIDRPLHLISFMLLLGLTGLALRGIVRRTG